MYDGAAARGRGDVEGADGDAVFRPKLAQGRALWGDDGAAARRGVNGMAIDAARDEDHAPIEGGEDSRDNEGHHAARAASAGGRDGHVRRGG